jgi:hypothetical protein
MTTYGGTHFSEGEELGGMDPEPWASAGTIEAALPPQTGKI